MTNHHSRRLQQIILAFLSFLFLSALLVLLLATNMLKNMSHDQHQYIASGAMLAREGLLPYVDYPYFHMPNLVFVYAALYTVTDHLVLVSRAFSTVCAWITLSVVYCAALSLFRRVPYLLRFLLAAGGVILILTNPLFLSTSGKSWNHDLSILLALLAFVIHSLGARRERGARWLFLSGLLLGLAIGTRLTFAPAVLPFLFMIWWYPRPEGWKGLFTLLVAFGAGLFVGLLPSFVLFALAPQRFLFGNFGYASYNTLYRSVVGFDEGRRSAITMTLAGKLEFLFRHIVGDSLNSSLLLLAFLLFALILNVVRLKRKPPFFFEVGFALVLVPFLLGGSLAPTPTYYHYLYPLVPFLVLGVLYGIASSGGESSVSKWALALWGVLIVVASLIGMKDDRWPRSSLGSEDWVPIEVHETGVEAVAEVGSGPVLTLYPIFPLEGGAQIYKEYVTGPFAWRVSPFIPEADRLEVGVVSPAELDEFLQPQRPAAILIGTEPRQEQPLVEYAQRNGYLLSELSSHLTLWLPPLTATDLTFGQQIRLVGHRFTCTGDPTACVARLQWEAVAVPTRDYTVFVHLLGPDGAIVAQDDAPLGDSHFPTSTWLPGDIVPDVHYLDLPSDAPPGNYSLVVGLYHYETGERLEAVDAGGIPLGDAVLLVILPVGEPGS